MQRHRIDLVSLVLGLLAIAAAVGGLTGTIDADWLDPTVAVSIAALVAVVLVVAVVVNTAIRSSRRPADDPATQDVTGATTSPRG